jgi:hypothetical protein
VEGVDYTSGCYHYIHSFLPLLLTVNTAPCTAHFQIKTIKLGHGAFDLQDKRSVSVRGKYYRTESVVGLGTLLSCREFANGVW